jgi:carbonic anhydrase
MSTYRVQGHSNCVGCLTALRASQLPPVQSTQALQRFLSPLTALARSLASDGRPPSLDLLIEVCSVLSCSAGHNEQGAAELKQENVVQQVKNILACDVIQQVSTGGNRADVKDWKRRGSDGVVIHGWVYHLEDASLWATVDDRALTTNRAGSVT